jgi:hypothetical protein
MRIPRVLAAGGLGALFSMSAGLAQSIPGHSSSAAVAGSIVFPADEHTEASIGGSVEVNFPSSRFFSAGVAAGHWSGQSDFVQDSTETYIVGQVTHRWGTGKVRPFLQAGGGVYFVKFQFQSRNRFAPEEKDVVGGGFAGGGLDYSLSTTSALEMRARYHLVSVVSGVHPHFLETQLGVRFFF